MPQLRSLRLISLALMALVLALCPGAARAQTEKAPAFTQEQLDQIVAPIALYSDSLLSQVFMASTYPLEIVEADRWVKKNPDLKGDALANALNDQSWDASVKSLVNTPDVLEMMSQKLDWTTKLGDAFVSQQDDVMAAVQRLRAKAKESGNLKTTEQQKVEVQQQGSSQVIVIQQANPQVIYVPVYNPTVVYGVWPYPSYPPYYYYPPAYTPRPGLWFGAGFACGAAWGYAWGRCDWGYHGNSTVKINVNQNINYNRNIKVNNEYKRNINGGSWQHNPEHRKGVAYRDQTTAQRYNRGASTSTVQARESFRGRTSPYSSPQGAAANQNRARQTGAGAQNRSRPNQPTATPNRAGSGNAFSGSNQNAQRTRDASARGSQSRSSSGASRSRPSPSSSGARSRPSGGGRSGGGARRR